MKNLKRERNRAFEETLAKKGGYHMSPYAIRGVDLRNPFHFEIVCNEVNCEKPDPEIVSAIIPMLDIRYEDDREILRKILEKNELAELHTDAKKKLQESNA